MYLTKKKKKKLTFFGGCWKTHFLKFQAPPCKRGGEGSTNQQGSEVARHETMKQQRGVAGGGGQEGTSK